MVTFLKDSAVIVVGVDYSRNSNEALGAACAFARIVADVAIHFIHVTSANGLQPFAGMPRPIAASVNPAPLDELLIEKSELEALAQCTAASVAADGARVFGHLRTGNAAREIVQLASDLSADLIVIGTQGRTGMMNVLLGSVAQNVLANASCPVLGVKPEGVSRWPEIEPPCPDCLTVQRSLQGPRLWCGRHSQHYARAHTYSVHSDGYGLGAQTFRGLG